MFANGKSKLRGTQTGGVQQNSKWRALAISTGEEPLSNSRSQDGVRSRVLEIYGKPIENESIASNMYSFTTENYGIAGKIYIMELIKRHSHNNYQNIKKLHNDIKEELKERCPNINYAQLSYIALITTTDIIIGDMLFHTDRESSLKMAEEIIENITKTEHKDVIDNAYSYISDWILSNTSRFDVREIKKVNEEDKIATEMILNAGKTSERFGLYENGVFYILPTKFTQKLEQQGFNAEKVKQGFKERNYIITDSETSTTIKMFHKGEEREFIGFKLCINSIVDEKQMKELEEKDIETTYITPKIPSYNEIFKQ